MRKYLLPISAALVLIACRQEKAVSQPTSGASASPSAVAATAPAAEAAARVVKDETELYEFEYSYPAQAAAIPPLKAWLDADLAKRKAEVVGGAQEDKKAADSGEFPFRAHSGSTEWKLVTDIPGWLSLSSLVGGYTGGAHPNYAYTALLWDKAAGQRREAADLFQSKAALSEAIRKPFCDALDAQRAQKRGAKIDRDSGDPFDECIDPLESAVILGSSNRRTFDRIGVLISPYSAGPYAEGDYEVTLPVTPAVLAAVKPEYRASFTRGR